MRCNYRLAQALGLVLVMILPASAQEPEPDQDQLPQQSAQTAETASPQAEAQASGRPIEEITVQGERTFHSLRMEIESVETEVYEIFNELNSNDEFDFTCKDMVFTGSHLGQRVCMAEYLIKEEQYLTREFLLHSDSAVPGFQLTRSQIGSEVRQKTEALEQEMIRVATEHPRFAEALLRLTALVGMMEQKKKQNPFYLEQ